MRKVSGAYAHDGMRCPRHRAGAQRPAPSTPAGSSRPDADAGRRRARLSFLIPCFALLLGTLSPFAAAQTPPSSGSVWSATLTVKALKGFRLGCTTGELNIARNCSTEATLSDDDFTVGATTYIIRRIQFFFDEDILQLRFSTGPNTALKALNFCVGTTAYALSRMTTRVAFWDSDVGWSVGDTVTLSIGSSCSQGTPAVRSPDATLSELAASGSTSVGGMYSALSLTPSTFSATVTSYTATVPNATTHAKLTPTVNEANATVKVGKQGTALTTVASGLPSGAIALVVGANAITARVTAQDSTVKDYTVTITRQAQAAVPTVTLSASPNPVSEGASVTVTATLSQALSGDVTIPLTITDHSAEPEDHGTLASIAIASGATRGTGTITTHQDTDSVDETFTVALGALPSEVTAGSPSSVRIRITDDDRGGGGLGGGGGGGGGGGVTPPAVTLSAAPNPVTEGSAVTVTATLSRALSSDVTIPLAVTRDTSEPGDHGTLSSIAVAAGATSGTGTIATRRDADPHDETFTVTLDTGNLPSQVTAGSTASVTVRIDDDAPEGAAPAPEVGFFPAASRTLGGMARVVNLSDEAGTVRVRAFDDAGEEYPAQTLALGAGFGVGFSPADLEGGNPDQGLSGTGAGSGDWRLAFESDLDLRVLALARPPGGGLAPVHDSAPGSAAGGYEAVFFNPASNRGLASRLRLANRSGSPATVTITGTDAAGRAGESTVTLRIPARAACTLSAPVLESGEWGDTGPAAGCGALTGALGDGAGKWRLMVTADQPLSVMSLLASAAGHLTNLSSAPARAEEGVHRLALLPPADDVQRQGFVRLVNRDARAGTVTVRAFDDAGEEYPAQTLALGAGFGVQFSAADLEEGHETLGLTGTGSGAGRWRLVLEPAPADLDLQALAYVRNPGSSGLAALHDTAPGSLETGWKVAFFNPASNRGLASRLRLANRSDAAAAVRITGTDAAGQAGESPVTLTLPARAACTLRAPVLESGTWGDDEPGPGCGALTGALGDGAGKWRLSVTADQPLSIMSLLRHTASGALSNLSTTRE